MKSFGSFLFSVMDSHRVNDGCKTRELFTRTTKITVGGFPVSSHPWNMESFKECRTLVVRWHTASKNSICQELT